MFYVGICIDENRPSQSAVVVEKVLRNAKKEYAVHDILSLAPSQRGGNVADAVEELYRSPDYIRKKKVFSQSKRPAKNTYNPPMILIHEKNTGAPVVDCLRERQVPVDAFFFHDLEGWKREDRKIIRQGGDLYLNPDTMASLTGVITSKRLILASDEGLNQDLCGEISRYVAHANDPGGLPHLFGQDSFVYLPPLFLILWHCETLRQIKRY